MFVLYTREQSSSPPLRKQKNYDKDQRPDQKFLDGLHYWSWISFLTCTSTITIPFAFGARFTFFSIGHLSEHCFIAYLFGSSFMARKTRDFLSFERTAIGHSTKMGRESLPNDIWVGSNVLGAMDRLRLLVALFSFLPFPLS